MEQQAQKMPSSIRTFGILIGGIVIGSLITAGIMLSLQKKKAVDISEAMGSQLLNVDGKLYTTADLPGDAGMELYQLESNIHFARENFAKQIALRIALSKDAGKKVSSEELAKLADLLPVSPVTEAEAKLYYDKVLANAGSTAFGGQSFEKIKSQLIQQMSQQKQEDAINSKIQILEAGQRVKILLTQPVAPAVNFDLTAFPDRGGSKESNVTLVEVSDYLCPHCREVEPIIEKLAKDFSDKVKFVQVNYSLSPSGLSGALTRGAYCAFRQGREQFWEYHRFAFQVPWSKMRAPAGEDSAKFFNIEATEVAKNAKLNATLFEACLTSETANDYLRKVQEQFNASTGFQGTPTFYLNGRLIQVTPSQLDATIRAALK